MSRFATTVAHLTTSAEAQEVENQIEKLAKSGPAAVGSSADVAQASFREIDEQLLGLEVPTDEWDILYRLRVQVERDLLAGSPARIPSEGSGSSDPVTGASGSTPSSRPGQTGEPAGARSRKAVVA